MYTYVRNAFEMLNAWGKEVSSMVKPFRLRIGCPLILAISLTASGCPSENRPLNSTPTPPIVEANSDKLDSSMDSFNSEATDTSGTSSDRFSSGIFSGYSSSGKSSGYSSSGRSCGYSSSRRSSGYSSSGASSGYSSLPVSTDYSSSAV